MNILKIFKYFSLFIILWFTIHFFILLFVGLIDCVDDADIILIFGNKVELNGEPSKRLQGRLDRGGELFKENKSRIIVVSGGIGKEGFDEAHVMKEYLIDKGIPSDSIIEDNGGINTYETAVNLKNISEDIDIDSVIIISNYYHLLRAKLAISKIGFNPVYVSHSKMFPEIRDFYSIPREIVGYYFYLFKDYKI